MKTVLCVVAFLVSGMSSANDLIKLPEPLIKGVMSVEEAISNRRSIRSYKKTGLTLNQVSQLLWAAQGITEKKRGFRSAPSAGATYPLTAYLVAGEVEGLAPGVYQYIPERHALRMVSGRDVRPGLARASYGQGWVAAAPATIVLAARYERTTRVYGKRGVRYVDIEVGHAGENIYLQATALGLGTVAVGAFSDDAVKKILGIEEVPLYLMPVGVK
ncbi:MAG: SagB/ThcOx family dehydrogenase [Candidatus Tritonobacter lacicola]|nr:SagB/ThcOx family dehydrogenase [Candidatus Tritonobacter lacicola]